MFHYENEDTVFPAVAHDFLPVWELDGVYKGQGTSDLSRDNPDRIDRAEVSLTITFKREDSFFVVRKNAFSRLDNAQDKVTVKQHQRLCKGILAGVRSGLHIETLVHKRTRPQNFQIDVHSVRYHQKSIRLLALEIATVAALEVALGAARKDT